MLTSYLITVAMKSSLLLALGLMSLRVLRKADAGLRHSICVLSLGAALSTLLVAWWSPQWSIVIAISPVAVAASGGTSVAQALRWPTIVSVAWALGALAMLCRLMGGLYMLALARRRSRAFRIHDGVEARIGRTSVPMTCGVFRPMVLLPESARSWDEMRLSAVLLHELAHVRRRDCLAKHLAQWSRALLWWNPLAWMVAARLDTQQELACDAAVLDSGISADSYANILLETARDCSSALLFGCAMSRGTQGLRVRLANLFERPIKSSRRRFLAVPAILVALTLTAPSFAEKIYKMSDGIVPPKILLRTEPQYTEEAKDAKIEGTVVLTIVVGTDQRAHDIKVIKPLDSGLDANAIASIETWQFQPGTKDGKPVAVRATVQVNFRLQ